MAGLASNSPPAFEPSGQPREANKHAALAEVIWTVGKGNDMHDPPLLEFFDDESPMYRLERHIGSTLTLPVKFSLLNTKFCVKIEIRKPEEEESLLLSENIMTWPSSLI